MCLRRETERRREAFSNFFGGAFLAPSFTRLDFGVLLKEHNLLSIELNVLICIAENKCDQILSNHQCLHLDSARILKGIK